MTITTLPPINENECMDDNNEKELYDNDKSSQFIAKKWDDFDLKMDLLRGIYCIGFENPSPIQQRAILPILNKRDVIAQAQSGTGKTGAFTIGTLQRIDTTISKVHAIIMEPTHELANQTTEVVRKIGCVMEHLVVQTLVGGSSVDEDALLLRENVPHIIVGTPGRIFDMIKRGYINTKGVSMFVIDEADDMLSTGFKDQIYNIFQTLSETVQVVLFSATLPPEILELTKKFMIDPVQLTMKNEQLNLDCIQQYYLALASDHDKYGMLKWLFEYLSISQCIIYVNSVKRVIDLNNAMTEEGFSVCCIHSSMNKHERDTAFKNFKDGQYRVLISSNITARGIDIQQVSIVINFDIPKCVHTYLHRIGRSGRWGRKGVAINFVTKFDIKYMKFIESHYKSSIAELPTDGNIQNILLMKN